MGQSYLKNAALLTGADVLLRLAGMGLRIYLANALGGEGMGLYQLVLAVYALFVTLATAGVSVAATRLMAEELARGRAQARGMLVRLAGTGLLLGAAGLLGGTIQALSGATGSKATGLLLGTLAIPLLSAAMIRASRMRRDVQTVRVRMTYKKRTARFSAVVDSGNCLRDYLTHKPVIVIPQARGNRLFGLEDTPLRPIFADTAGGRQMMFCLTPERTILCDGRNEWACKRQWKCSFAAQSWQPQSRHWQSKQPARRSAYVCRDRLCRVRRFHTTIAKKKGTQVAVSLLVYG